MSVTCVRSASRLHRCSLRLDHQTHMQEYENEVKQSVPDFVVPSTSSLREPIVECSRLRLQTWRGLRSTDFRTEPRRWPNQQLPGGSKGFSCFSPCRESVVEQF